MNIFPSNLSAHLAITPFHCIFSKVISLEPNIRFCCMSASLLRFFELFDWEKQFSLKFQKTQFHSIPFILKSSFFRFCFLIPIWHWRNFAVIVLDFHILTCLNPPDFLGWSGKIIKDFISDEIGSEIFYSAIQESLRVFR